MELNINKIKDIKRVLGFTWLEIAQQGGLKTKQAVYDKLKPKRIKSAEFFGKIFNINPKDLIK